MKRSYYHFLFCLTLHKHISNTSSYGAHRQNGESFASTSSRRKTKTPPHTQEPNPAWKLKTVPLTFCEKHSWNNTREIYKLREPLFQFCYWLSKLSQGSHIKLLCLYVFVWKEEPLPTVHLPALPKFLWSSLKNLRKRQAEEYKD